MAVGWVLSSSSATYEDQGGEKVTIFGLRSGLSLADLSKVMDVTEHNENDGVLGVITLKAGALPASATGGLSVKLSNANYKLVLDDSVVEYDETAATVLGSTVTAGGSITIEKDHSAGWQLGTGGMSVVYIADGANTTLATVTGLLSQADKVNVSLSSSNILLKTGALSSVGTVQIIGDNASSFSLKLTDDGSTAVDSMEGATVYSARWEDEANGDDVYYISDTTKEYWKVDNNQIVYHEGGKSAAIKISGLAASISAALLNNKDNSPIKLTGKVFSMSAAALSGTTTFKLTNGSGSGVAAYGYSLSLASDVARWSKDTIISGDSISTAGTAYVQAKEYAGWGIDGVNYSLHTAASDTLATISGLSKIAKLGTAGISLASASSKIITLGVSAFDTTTKGNVVTITNKSKYENYSLSLAAGVSYTAFDAAGGSHVLAVNGTSATVYRTQVSGYTASSGLSIGYTVGQKVTLASITGMKNNGDNKITLNNTENSQKGTVLTIAQDAFDNYKTITLIDKDANDDKNFSLSIASDVTDLYNDKGNIQFDTAGVSTKGEALLVNFHEGGWSLAGTSGATMTISYGASNSDTLATISGLSTKNVVIGATGLSIASQSSEYILLGASAFGTAANRTINIVDNNADDGKLYSLSLATDDLKSKVGIGGKLENNPYLSIVSATGTSTALVMQGLSAGYSVLSSSTAISYTASSAITLAKITGLSAGATSSVLSLSATDHLITFKKGALNSSASSVVSITDKFDESSLSSVIDSYTQNFTYSIALDTTTGQSFAAADLYDQTGVVSLSGISAGNAYVVNTHAAGWSWTGTATGVSTINFARKSIDTLATITGLSTGATAEHLSLSGTVGDTSLITLKLGAINNSISKMVRLVDNKTNDDYNYTLSLAGGYSTLMYDVDGKISLSFAGIAGGSAHVVNTHAAGWSMIGSTSTVITYRDTEVDSLATITGLANAASINGNASLSSNVVTLNNYAITTKSITLVNAPSGADKYYNYTLSLAGTSTGKLGFKVKDNYWSIEDNTAVYKYDTNQGWKLGTFSEATHSISIAYTPKTTTQLATITNLTNLATITGANGAVGISGITVSGDSIGSYSGTITLNKNVLSTQPMTFTNAGSASYGLSLGADVSAAGAIEDASIGANAKGSRDIIAKLAGGYSIVTGSFNGIKYTDPITYTVATITGLNTKTLPTGSVSINVKDNVITLGMSALTSGVVSLTNKNLREGYVGGYSATGTTGDKYKFTLAMEGGASKLGFTDGEDKWVVDKDTPADGTAAVLQYTTSEGWSLSSNSLAFTYTGASNNTIVKITNLNTKITAVNGTISGINVVAHVNDDPTTPSINENKAGTITLDRSVLGTVSGAANSSVFTIKQFKVGSSDTPTDMYTIGINQDSLSEEYVPTEKSDDVQRWTFDRNGATFSTYDSEYWTFNSTDKTITYSGESDVRTHATLTGLVTDQPSDEVIAGAISVAYIDNISHSNGTIYLGSGVLNKANASISSATGNSFTIAALSTGSYAVSAPTLTNEQWKVSSTTAQYTGKLTEGYEATKDGKQLIYSKDSDNAIVASVTGLKKGLVVGAGSAWIGVGTAGASTVTKSLQLDTATRVITLSKAVLDEKDIAVTGTDYTLRLGGDVNTTTNSYNNVWHVGSSSYTYDSVRSAYYTLGTGSTSIQATRESIVSHLAYITGLKSGLTTDDDGQIAGISVGTNKKIYLSKSVLNTTTDTTGKAITKITNANNSNTYSITGASDVYAPTAEDNLTWKVSSGTATRTGTMNEGWIFAANGFSATYYKKDTAFTFATVKGLNSKVTAAVLNSSTGLTSGSQSASVKAVTLSTNVLGGTSVTVSGSSDPRVGTNYGGYSLVLNTSDSASYTGLRSKAVAADIWATVTSDTTYTYKNVNLDYYSLASGTNPTVASYVAESLKSTYATFTNLKKGLVDASAPSTIAGVSVISKVITFNEVSRADTSSNVSVGTLASGYSVSLAAAIKPYDDNKKYWIINPDNNTAIYQSDVTGGYSYSGTSKVIYYINDHANERAKLAGLRDGLKVTGSGYSAIAGISIGTGADTLKITLARDVLTTSSVTLTGSDKYSITAVTDGDVSSNIKTAWTGTDKNSTSATLINYTPAKYATVSNGKGVTYTKESLGSAIATVSGLKKGTLIVDPYADGQIAGISVGNSTVTLSSGVLDKKNVTLVNASTVAASMYSLAVDSSGDDSVAGASGVWQWAFNKSKGTATYNYSIVGGYAVGSTSTTTPKNDLIVYTPTKTLKTTITNLKPTVTISSGVNNSIGIKQGDAYIGITGYNFALSSGVGFSATDTTSTIHGTITLASEVLNSKNVTISSNNAKVGSFLLGLAEKDVKKPGDPVWNKTSNTSDKATYEQTTAAGYTLADDSKSITYSDKPTTKVLATLTGLKKTVVAQSGNIEGITVTGGSYANVAAGISVNTPGIITIDTNVLSNANLTLGKTDNFNLSLAGVGTSVAVSLGTANYSRDILNKNKVAGAAAALSFAVKYANPTWTYNASKGTAALNVGTTEGWALKQTAGAGTSSADDDEYKQITYTAAKPVNIANITGLKKNSESAFKNGVGLSKLGGGTFTSREAVGMSSGTMSGVVSIINKDVLTNANLKIAVAKGQTSNYNFTLGISAADLAAKDGENVWSVAIDKKGSLTGTATYQYGTTQGWKLNSASGEAKDTLTYSAAKTTTLATLTNLDKKSDILNAVVKGKATGKATTVSVSSIEGLSVGAPVGLSSGGSAAVITVSDIDLFGKNKVTLTNGKNTGIAYSLSLGDEVASKATADAWSIASKGTVAYYKNMRTAGYTLDKTSTVATYNTESATNTRFTLKGLKKGNKVEDIAANIDVAGDNVYVHDAVTGTTNITLTQGKVAAGSTSATKYQFATDYISTPTLSAPKFNTKTGGTVTLTQVTSAGFTLGANGKQQGNNTLLKYSKQKTTTLATIKGLNAKTEGTGKNKKPLLTVGSDSSSGTPISVVGLKTTSASGAVSYPTVITYDDKINTITVKKDALIAKNVTITSQKTNPYTLVIGDDVQTYAEETTEWVVSGTTGSYKTYDKSFYSYKKDKNGDDVKTTIVYNKPTAGTTYAKVTNLFKNTSLSASNASGSGIDFVTKGGVDVSGDTGGVLTLEKAKLTAQKSVALTDAITTDSNYILQLGDDFTGNISSLGSAQWTASNGTVTAIATRSAGYDLAFGMKSVTYNKTANSKQVVAKLTGLATTITGTAVSPDSNNVITLNDNQLVKKNVVLSTSQGDINYTLKLGSVSAPVITETNQTIKNGTLTLTGEVTQAGYVLGSSSTAITYVKASASKTNKTTGDVTYTPYTLATFKGVEDTTTLDLNVATGSEPTAAIKGVNLNNTSTITPGAFKVEITGTFKDKTINGSNNADSFVLSNNATNVTVNTGKGNDYVDLGNGKGNVFVYANGNGNDVVNNFDLSTNKFKLTSGTLAAEHDGADIVVKVGSGNVILKGAYGTDENAIKQLTVLNSKNAESTYTIYPNTHVFKTSSSGLIEDDNFSTDAVLSDIVTGDQGSVTNFNFNTMGTRGMGMGMSQKQDFMTSFASSNKK